MTAVASPPDSPAPAIGAAAPEQAATRARRVSPATQMITTAVLILSATLLGFALYVGVISTLHHDRAQHNAYANFGKELALATAPTGPMQPEHPDRPLPLGAPVAALHIPKLHLREVVFEGTTPSVLRDGPGHLRSTVLPGQAGISEIMGRAATYGGPFSRLSTLDLGDTITITTGPAANTYRVLDVRHAGDPVPKPLAPRGRRLLLATAQGAPFIPSGVGSSSGCVSPGRWPSGRGCC